MMLQHGSVAWESEEERSVSVYNQKLRFEKCCKTATYCCVVVHLFLLVQQNAHNKQEKVTQAPTFLTVLESKHVGSISFLPTKVIKVCCQIFVFHVFWY